MLTNIGIHSIGLRKLKGNVLDLTLLSFNPLDDIAFTIADSEYERDYSRYCSNHRRYNAYFVHIVEV